MSARIFSIALLSGLLAATPGSAEKLTVSQYGRIIATLPWAVALEKGFFKEAKLDVDGITAGAGGGTSVRNMLAGSLPFAELSTSAVVAAVKAGVELKIVDTASNHPGELAWASKPNAGIKSIKDLVGKKIGFTNPKSTTEMVLRAAVAKEGLTGKVELLAMGGLGPAITALNQGAIAAAPLNDPQMTLEPQNFNILFHAFDYYPNFSWSVDVTTPEFAAKSPDKVRALVKVHRKAVEFIYANPDEAAKVYAKVWEVSDSEAKAILPKYIQWKHWSNGEFSKEGLLTVENGMRAVGDLEGSVDWSKIVDQSYLDEDQRRPL